MHKSANLLSFFPFVNNPFSTSLRQYHLSDRIDPAGQDHLHLSFCNKHSTSMAKNSGRKRHPPKKDNSALLQSDAAQMTTTSTHPQPELQTTQQPFRFLDLPAELRISIYEALFEDSTTEIRPENLQKREYRYRWSRLDNGDQCFSRQPCPPRPKPTYHTPALLLVSKQLRSEALDIFFSHTKWTIRSHQLVKSFLDKLGQDRAALLTRLCYVLKQGSEEATFRSSIGVWLLNSSLDSCNVVVQRSAFWTEVEGEDGKTLVSRRMSEGVPVRLHPATLDDSEEARPSHIASAAANGIGGLEPSCLA